MDKLKVILGLCALALLFSFSIFSYYHVTEVEGTVVEKYTKRGNKEDKFFFVVEDKEGKEVVVENTDSLLMLKFDSADVQAKVKVGKHYKVEMRGWRASFLSMFPNVDTIEEVK